MPAVRPNPPSGASNGSFQVEFLGFGAVGGIQSRRVAFGAVVLSAPTRGDRSETFLQRADFDPRLRGRLQGKLRAVALSIRDVHLRTAQNFRDVRIG